MRTKKPKPICKVARCPRPAHSYGLCNMHAQQQRRSGKWPPKKSVDDIKTG